MPITALLTTALAKRDTLINNLSDQLQPKTDCFRVFHGTVEGVNGLNIDRYGDAWLIQTFHETLTEEQLAEIKAVLLNVADLPLVYNDRSNKNSRIINELDENSADLALHDVI